MAKRLVYQNGKMVFVDTDDADYVAPPDVQQLVYQRGRMQNKIQAMGGEERKGGPSIFSRAMDILSRPNYAVANFAKSFVDDDDANPLAELGRGLAGREKTTFSNVLDEAGMPGGWQRTLLGLGLDIGLDPTTYLTGGVSAASGVAARAAKGAQAASAVGDAARTAKGIGAVDRLNDILDTYKVARVSKTPAATGRAMAIAEQAELLKMGGKPMSLKQLRKAAERGANATALDLSRAAQKAAEDAVEVKKAMLNLKLGPAKASIPLKAPKVTKRLLESPYVQGLNRNFRTAGTYGREMNETRKLRNSQGIADYDHLLQAKHPEFGGKSWEDVEKMLTDDEAKNFFDAYEHGDLSMLPATSSKGLEYDELARMVKKMNDEFYDAELDAGIFAYKRDPKTGAIEIDPTTGRPIPEVERLENYLYHHVKRGQKGRQAWKNQRRKAIASDAHAPGVKRALKFAKDAPPGVVIERDIRIAMRNRAAKHTQAMARTNFLNDAIENFGVPVAEKGTLKTLQKDGHDLVNLKNKLKDVERGAALEFIPENTFVHREIADKLGGVLRTIDDPGPFMEFADRLVRWWKPLATVYNPGHHVRNFVSDIYLNFLDGVVDPNVYKKAFKLRAMKKVDGTTKIGSAKIADDQILKLFRETGASPGFMITETPMSGAMKKPARAVHGFSEGREEIGRLAHFIDAFKKEAKGIRHGGVVTPAMEAAAHRAAARVKKWNLDYSDLTDFERTRMKRLIPFYTWMRKSTPLMLEAMALRPGRVVAVPKTLTALEQLLGIDPSEKLPTDLIPKWIREGGGIQLGTTDRGNPLMMLNNLPIMDPFNWVEGGKEGILRNALSSINPLLKMPIEHATGQSIFTGAPTSGATNYAAELIPAGRLINKAIKPQTPDTDKGNTDILRWLTGAGIHEVTPNNMRGEIRRQMDPMESYIAAANKRREASGGKRLVWKDGKLVVSNG